MDQACFGMHMSSRDGEDSGPNLRPPSRELIFSVLLVVEFQPDFKPSYSGVHALTDIVNLTDSNVKILMNVLKVLTNVTISMELVRI